MKALVVFDRTGNEGPFSRLLKAGWKHCSVCLESGEVWISLNAHGWNIAVAAEATCDYDLAGEYRDLGYTVIETETHPYRAGITLMHGTCVGMVKRVLGIRAFWIQTPHQLYKHLEKS